MGGLCELAKSSRNLWPQRFICKQNTWWEGGIRVPSLVYSPLFDSGLAGQSNDCLFHITDWFSTILGFAGNTEDLGVDGIDQWASISSMGSSCPRKPTFAFGPLKYDIHLPKAQIYGPRIFINSSLKAVE